MPKNLKAGSNALLKEKNTPLPPIYLTIPYRSSRCTLPNALVVDQASTMDSGVYHMYMSELLFELGSRLRVYDNLQEADGTWKSEGEIMVDVDNFEVAKPVASGSKPNLQIL